MRLVTRFLSLAGLALATFHSSQVWAFPENVRHGYPNCASCHVNPNGKGILNPYGRELSVAIQSYGKFFFEPSSKAPEESAEKKSEEQDKEAQFLYGYFPQPDWLLMGGDIRFLQLFASTPAYTMAQFITMQLDLEAAVKFGKFTVDASVGRDDPTLHGNANPAFGDWFVSRNHYILFQATDELFFMGGKYWKPYGILDANHSTLVKGGDGYGLGWDYDSQSYNLQVGYQTNSYSLTAYADFGSPTTAYGPIEQGGGGTASVFFANSYKVGASFFYGTTDQPLAIGVPAGHRYVFGPWGILGFTEHFYLNTENNLVREFGTASILHQGFITTAGLATSGCRAFTPTSKRVSRSNVNDNTTQVQYYGVGLLYYPRTHWEFEANVQQRNIASTGYGFTTFLYFQLHYYL